MRPPLLSRLPVDRAQSPGLLTSRHDAPPHIVAQALDWPGVLLESGRNDVAEARDVALPRHYLSLNADARPYTSEVAGPRGLHTNVHHPGAVWVLPAGDPITIRLDTRNTYIRFMIDPAHLDGLLARSRDEVRRVELRRTFGVLTPQLSHLLRALASESRLGNPSGVAFVETLTAAVGQQLALHAGVERPPPERAQGGLAPVIRRRILELIDAKLDARLTVEALSREAGLSPAHFARAFKQSTGHAPHRFLLALRLRRARRMLDAPDAVLSDVALRNGFADQPHFTRLFKREFGVTPGAVLRSRARLPSPG